MLAGNFRFKIFKKCCADKNVFAATKICIRFFFNDTLASHTGCGCIRKLTETDPIDLKIGMNLGKQVRPNLPRTNKFLRINF